MPMPNSADEFPKILYFKSDGVTPVPSSQDPDWFYTQFGDYRTQKNGRPQKFTNGVWVDL